MMVKEINLFFKRKFEKFNYKNISYVLICFLFLALSMFFGEVNNSHNSGAFGTSFSLAGTIIFYLLIVLNFALILYIGKINNILKFNKGVIIFIFIGVLTTFYMIGVDFGTDYNRLFNNNSITILDKFKSIMDVSLSIMMCFVLIYLISPFKEKDLAIRIFCFIFVGFSLVMIIYSLITEMDIYIAFIKNPTFFTKYDSGNVNAIWCVSFFKYGNVYGHVLFLLCLVILLLSVSYNRRFIFLFSFLVGIFILFSGSRTAFFGFFTLMISYGITFLISLYKSNKLYFSILLFFFIFLIIFGIFEIFVFKLFTIREVITKSDGSKEVINYTLLDLLKKYFSYVDSRIDIYRSARTRFIWSDFIFGIGYNMNDLLSRTFNGSYFNYHNGFLEVYTTGGIYLSALYIFLIVYIFHVNNKLFVRTDRYKYYLYVITLPYLIYQLGEAFPILYNVFGGGVTAIIFIMVPFNKVREANEICNINKLFIK